MEIEDIKRVEFRPGDKLIVRSASVLTLEHEAHISAELQRFAPDVPHMVLGPDLSIEVLSETST